MFIMFNLNVCGLHDDYFHYFDLPWNFANCKGYISCSIYLPLQLHILLIKENKFQNGYLSPLFNHCMKKCKTSVQFWNATAHRDELKALSRFSWTGRVIWTKYNSIYYLSPLPLNYTCFWKWVVHVKKLFLTCAIEGVGFYFELGQMAVLSIGKALTLWYKLSGFWLNNWMELTFRWLLI